MYLFNFTRNIVQLDLRSSTTSFNSLYLVPEMNVLVQLIPVLSRHRWILLPNHIRYQILWKQKISGKNLFRLPFLSLGRLLLFHVEYFISSQIDFNFLNCEIPLQFNSENMISLKRGIYLFKVSGLSSLFFLRGFTLKDCETFPRLIYYVL